MISTQKALKLPIGLYSFRSRPKPNSTILFRRSFVVKHPRMSQYERMMKQNLVKKTLQENPGILNGKGTMEKPQTSFLTVVLLVAASSSLTMLLYLGSKVYKVSLNELDNASQCAFLPLWLSFNWPWHRKFGFPLYLKYFDPEFHEYVESIPNFTDDLHLQNVQFLVLDELFRLKLVRDTFGIPLLLKTEDLDFFDSWIETDHPTIHGPKITITKSDGKTRLAWRWAISPLPWWGDIDKALTAFGFKLDRLDPNDAMRKTSEKSSGRVHEATSIDGKPKRVVTSDKDYNIVFLGLFHLSNSSTTKAGKVNYTGMIDFDHMGINKGARLTLIGLIVKEDETEVCYKIV